MKRHIILLSIFFSCIFVCKDLMAQTRKVTVTGTVYDAATRETLPSANIYIGTPPKGLGATNANGAFSFVVDEGSKLMFSYTGYESKTVTVTAANARLTILLSENKNQMDEVVIRGYQKRTRETTTGASYNISGKEIQDVPVANIEQLLQGKVAGLNIQNNTGAPGLRGSVSIRGLSTIATTGSGDEKFLQPTSPLYVIDGVPMDADRASEFGFQQQGSGVSPMSMIPQEDIASIEVLKDATATALYGSRGAYGVILIQTVRGKSETPRVRYTGRAFLSKTPKLRETYGGIAERNIKTQQILDYALIEDYWRINRTPYLSDSLNAYYNNSTNWQGIYYQDTYNMTHNVAIDGGTEQFNYKTNVGYFSQSGVIKNTGFDRYSMNLNMEYKPSTRLRFFGALMGALTNIQKADGVGLLQTGVADNGQTSSLLPGPSFFTASSQQLASLRVRNDAGPKYVKANMEATYQLIEGLTLTTFGSYDYNQDHDDRFTPAIANQQFARLNAYNAYTSVLYNRNSAVYQRAINDSHSFSVNLFTEMFIRNGQSTQTRLDRLPNDQFEGPLGYDGFESRGGGVLKGSFLDQKTVSLAAAIGYDFKKKYVVDLTYRVDGSSDAGNEDPYTINPSIGFKWNFNKESFFGFAKDWLTFGDIRLTAGRNIFPIGSLQEIYGRYEPRGLYNNSPSIGIVFENVPNPLLKPKVVTQYNAGLDLGLWNGKLDLIFDTYYKQVDNEKFDVRLPNTLAFERFVSNDAALANYGYEISLTSRPLSKDSKVNWTVMVNGAWNTDILTQLPSQYGGQFIDWDTGENQQHLAKRVGRNALANYLIINQGVYANTSDVPIDPVTGVRYRNDNPLNHRASFQAGDAKFFDANSDYVLDERDYQVSGSTQPTLTGGLSNTIGYKNFSLNVYASYTAQRSILNNALARRLRLMNNPFGDDAVVPLDKLNVWTTPGQVAKYANAYDYAHNSFTNPFRFDQTLWEEEGSYFKINEVTLSYSFDKKLAKRFGLNSFRPYVNAQNLVTFSGYSGPNAENVTAIGRDASNGYPVPRIYTFGVTAEF